MITNNKFEISVKGCEQAKAYIESLGVNVGGIHDGYSIISTANRLYKERNGESDILTYDLKAKFTELKAYCPFANSADFIEMYEWKNGEGFSFTVSNNREEKNYSLTWGEYEALRALVEHREEE